MSMWFASEQMYGSGLPMHLACLKNTEECHRLSTLRLWPPTCMMKCLQRAESWVHKQGGGVLLSPADVARSLCRMW